MTQLDRIAILDFGSQYTQLIARAIRELGVYSEIFPPHVSYETLARLDPKGIILSGGPESVVEVHTPRIPEYIFAMHRPVLGICYGMQAMARQLGGAVHKGVQGEFGKSQLIRLSEDPLLVGMQPGAAALEVWMSHGDVVAHVPPGFVVTAENADGCVAAMADLTRQYFGVQFHPEVQHTPDGSRVFSAFLALCGAQAQWDPAHMLETLLEETRIAVGSDHVLLGLSGGVDSAVAAALLGRAIGRQLHCVFVDNGLLRAGEAEQVLSVFRDQMGLDVRFVDAHARFYAALAGVEDPEIKRKTIGALFVQVFEETARSFPDPVPTCLAQGTIYPDVIESSATGHGSHLIKSHHNVGGLPEKLQLRLIEPLRTLFKDEVRKLGQVLGLPATVLARHPFPGPGLAVRILGEVTQEYLEIVRAADQVFMKVLHETEWYARCDQAFAVFLPVRTVGVVGDARQYAYVIALRAVCTQDFMTAHWAPLPHTVLEMAASQILNTVPGVARVVFDVSSKPPATIEWE